jgi:hypothetical protein
VNTGHFPTDLIQSLFTMAHVCLFALFSLLSLVSIGVSASPYLRRADFTVGQPVRTTSGTVVGHAAKTRPQVSEYLGIPYALPPVGSLRFAAPQRFNGTTNTTITASHFVSVRLVFFSNFQE